MSRLLALLTVAVATTDALVQAPSRHRPRMASARMSADTPTDLDGSRSRRGFGSAVATGVVALALGLPPSPAQAAGNAELIATVKEARKLLESVPDQLEAEKVTHFEPGHPPARPPRTAEPPVAANRPPPTTDHRPLAAHRPPLTTNHQPLTANHQRTAATLVGHGENGPEESSSGSAVEPWRGEPVHHLRLRRLRRLRRLCLGRPHHHHCRHHDAQQSKNPLKLIAKSMEDPDVFDAVDEISTSIQICDQVKRIHDALVVVHSFQTYKSSLFYFVFLRRLSRHCTLHRLHILHSSSTHHPTPDQFTYDNVFIYYQPGDGKVSPHHTKCLLLKLIEAARQASTGAKPRFANLTNLTNPTTLLFAFTAPFEDQEKGAYQHGQAGNEAARRDYPYPRGVS